jgi:aspartate-semialdehyde dehydrogenase
MRKYNVAVVGATGAVGRKMIEVLEERGIPVGDFYPFSSYRSAGSAISFHDRPYTVEELGEGSFQGRSIDFALFSAGSSTSQKFAPIAAESGAIAIDNSSAWRMDPAVPLVVPEVNGHEALKSHGIIANPNCSTIQAVTALKPIFNLYGIQRIVYSTYQAVSGSGLKGIKDLEKGIRGEAGTFYPKPIAYNIIPHIDDFLGNGYTKEEMKMVNETRKILGDEEIAITATCARVPVLYGHSESVNVETKRPFELSEVMQALSSAPGVALVDNPAEGGYPTPLDCEDTDLVYVGRVRRDFSRENGLNLWIVSDNIRKGAATNAVQIAEFLIANHAFQE